MPNYGLVINYEYNPMSFDEYVKPFQEYAKVYNQMADAYDSMEMEAGQWEKLAHSTKDAAQYAQYKKYADDLRAAASDLAVNGLSTKTRGSVSNLRKRYSSEIVPISEAWNYRNKMIEEQRKLNPTGDLQFDVNFANVGLGEIIQNPTLSYAPGRSLTEMEKAGNEMATAASVRRDQKIISNSEYYKIIQGFNEKDVKDFIEEVRTGKPDKFKTLIDLYNEVRSAYGTNSETSIYSQEQNRIADERILLGFLKGLTKSENQQGLPRVSYGRGRQDGQGGQGGQGLSIYGQYIRSQIPGQNGGTQDYMVFRDPSTGGIMGHQDNATYLHTDDQYYKLDADNIPEGVVPQIENLYVKREGNDNQLYLSDGTVYMDDKNAPIRYNPDDAYFDMARRKVVQLVGTQGGMTYDYIPSNQVWFSAIEEDSNKASERSPGDGYEKVDSKVLNSFQDYKDAIGQNLTNIPHILRGSISDPNEFFNTHSILLMKYRNTQMGTNKWRFHIINKNTSDLSSVDALPIDLNAY